VTKKSSGKRKRRFGGVGAGAALAFGAAFAMLFDPARKAAIESLERKGRTGADREDAAEPKR
jgi:hypothetical protein